MVLWRCRSWSHFVLLIYLFIGKSDVLTAVYPQENVSVRLAFSFLSHCVKLDLIWTLCICCILIIHTKLSEYYCCRFKDFKAEK